MFVSGYDSQGGKAGRSGGKYGPDLRFSFRVPPVDIHISAAVVGVGLWNLSSARNGGSSRAATPPLDLGISKPGAARQWTPATPRIRTAGSSRLDASPAPAAATAIVRVTNPNCLVTFPQFTRSTLQHRSHSLFKLYHIYNLYRSHHVEAV